MQTLPTILTLAIFSTILIFLSGWFSGTETALTQLNSLNLANMRKKEAKNIKFILKLKRDMNRTLITILIANNLVNIILSAVVALIADTLFKTIGVSIAIGLTTFFLILFGEIAPKSRAIRDSEKVASRNAKILYYIIKTFNPLISLFIILTRLVLKYTGTPSRMKNLVVTEESIMGMATLGQKEGLIKTIEKDIIHKVFTFGDKKSKEVMSPMTHVFHLNGDVPIEEAKKHIAKLGFTRIPIMKDKKVVGIVYSKDLIARKRGIVKDLARKPNFFPANSHITTVFSEMKKRRFHMAIIRNKHNKHIGIITLEDILEELVGEIHDEHDQLTHLS